MFERFTERARRVIYFARYEASQFGSTRIETEHMLLGLIREDKNLTNRFLRNSSAIESLRKEIEGRTTIREKISTKLDLPLSEECKHILAYAAEEAALLNHRHLGTEHLLLGILREENCLAAEVLKERGLRLEAIRDELARSVIDRQESARQPGPPWSEGIPKSGMERLVPDEDTARCIAKAIWTPVYGAETVNSQGAIDADLNFNVWRVTGSATGTSGGALFAIIHRMDGEVLAMGRTEFQAAEAPDV